MQPTMLPGQPMVAELMLVLSTNTWTSYNAWGGANAYRGLLPPVSYSGETDAGERPFGVDQFAVALRDRFAV